MTKNKEIELPKRKIPKYKETKKTFHLECMGLDEHLSFIYPDYNDGDDNDVFFIDHYIASFYSNQQPIRGYFRRLFCMLRCAIFNKEYSFYEIVLDKSQLKKFKKWIRSL